MQEHGFEFLRIVENRLYMGGANSRDMNIQTNRFRENINQIWFLKIRERGKFIHGV